MKLSRSFLGNEEKEAVARVIEDGYLGMGEEVRLFEEEIKKYLEDDVEVACVNTGTSALQVATQAVGVSPGDEVIIPSLTYVASFQAVSATGAIPIACDVHADTGLIDLQSAKKLITKNTKALMYVQYASNPGDLESLYQFGKENNLVIIEDAAHSFGCSYKGKKIGTIGDLVCFSFDGIKNITCGEGGAVVSKNKEWIDKIRDYRLLAVEKDTENRFKGKRSWDFDVKEQGWRYHMSNLMAAIGRVQLKKAGPMFKRRMELKAFYQKELSSIPHCELFSEADDVLIVPHIFPLKIKNSKRELIREELSKNGIENGFHYKANHQLTKYKTSYPLPVTEKITEEVISLPLHPYLSLKDASKVVQVIKETLS